jgi:hypothetical protein
MITNNYVILFHLEQYVALFQHHRRNNKVSKEYKAEDLKQHDVALQ